MSGEIKQKTNLILYRLGQSGFGPAEEIFNKLWDTASHNRNFPQLVAGAIDTGSQDINRVLLLLSTALKRDAAPRMAEVMPVLDEAVDKLKISDRNPLPWGNLWMSFLFDYTKKVGSETDKGKVAVSKLGQLARVEAFGPSHGNFTGIINELAWHRDGSEFFDRAMAGIWKGLVSTALEHHCLDSPQHQRLGARSISSLTQDYLFKHVERYSKDHDFIGEAAREILQANGRLSADGAPQPKRSQNESAGSPLV